MKGRIESYYSSIPQGTSRRKSFAFLISGGIIYSDSINNAAEAIWQSAKDKDEIRRRADARQRFLTQYFTL